MQQYYVLFLVLCMCIAQGASNSQSAAQISTPTTSTNIDAVSVATEIATFLASKPKPVITSTLCNVYFAKYCSSCKLLKPSDCQECDTISRHNLDINKQLCAAKYTTCQLNQGCAKHLWEYYCSACTVKTTDKRLRHKVH